MNVILAILWIILFWGSSSFAQGKHQMPHPWSKGNLFDSETKTYYIPYELWTGAPWNGVKEKKLHTVVLIGFPRAVTKRLKARDNGLTRI